MKRRALSAVALIAILSALLVGMTWLIHLRFESGESYPAGSSMRADPLGAKALYESYASLSGVEAKRNFEPFIQMETMPAEGVLLFLNTRGYGMYSLAHYDVVERFVSGGGDVVVALNPDRVAYQYLDDEGEFLDKEEESEKESSPEEKDSSLVEADEVDDVLVDEDTEEEDEQTAFARRATEKEERFWGEISLIHGEHEGGDAQASEAAKAAGLPAMLPWREGGVLGELGEDWVPLYMIEEEVVMAQRLLKNGRIVVMTDDYLFSNEAMMKHRYPALLAWVLGDQRLAIFDETHLGVAESTGIAILMRRYRLGGFFLGFAVLMALVVWRGMSPLLPAYTGRTKGNVILAEHSVEAGLSDLVSRSVPTRDLPVEAFRQWKLSFLRSDADRAYYKSELSEAEALLSDHAALAPRKRKPAETHSKIQSIINRKKRKRL
ncbi:MAG: DUF4350 domain-containing protein [Opitutaceae bacterium]